MRSISAIALGCSIIIGCIARPTLAAAEAPSAPPGSAEAVLDKFLTAGDLAGGERELSARLDAKKDDDAARFGLGLVQFLGGVQHLMQDLYAYGLKDFSGGGGGIDLPILRLPAPPNANPKEISYADSRRILEDWVKSLNRAEQTLAQVKSSDVKLPVRVGMIRLDFDGDGKRNDEETFWRIFARVTGAGVNAGNASAFAVAFDAGDVAWLRGYCHLLAALGEMALAYDGEELFNATAHMFFTKVNSPYPFFQEGKKVADIGAGVDIVDLIAFVHLIRLPVKEPARMTAALDHYKSVVGLSRESWKLIQAETDNDREWVPNPKQQSVLPNARVTQPIIDNWMKFLDEADDLLAGKRLAPFWRSKDGRGVNLRRVFIEPTKFDLVLWIQGSAATPYLEKGELTRPEVWREIERAFAGDFLGYAVWFN